jgi:hypothetical protein
VFPTGGLSLRGAHSNQIADFSKSAGRPSIGGPTAQKGQIVSTDEKTRPDFSRSENLLSSSLGRAAFDCVAGDSERILGLEIENARLQRLVAELLINNQELRQLINQSKRERNVSLIRSV